MQEARLWADNLLLIDDILKPRDRPDHLVEASRLDGGAAGRDRDISAVEGQDWLTDCPNSR